MKNDLSYVINDVNLILVQPYDFSKTSYAFTILKSIVSKETLCPLTKYYTNVLTKYNRKSDITVMLKIIYILAFCQFNGCLNFKPIAYMLGYTCGI